MLFRFCNLTLGVKKVAAKTKKGQAEKDVKSKTMFCSLVIIIKNPS